MKNKIFDDVNCYFYQFLKILPLFFLVICCMFMILYIKLAFKKEKKTINNPWIEQQLGKTCSDSLVGNIAVPKADQVWSVLAKKKSI